MQRKTKPLRFQYIDLVLRLSAELQIVCFLGLNSVSILDPICDPDADHAGVGRTAEFLTGSWQYTLALFTAAARINMLPKWLRPIAAPWLTSATRKHFADCLKAAEPVIKKRLAEVQHQKNQGSSHVSHVSLD